MGLNLQTEQVLADLIRVQDLSAVFLAETWLDKDRLKVLKAHFQFDDMLDVSRETRGGGLVVF